MPPVLDREEIEPWLAGETPTLSRSVSEDLRFFLVRDAADEQARIQSAGLHRALGGLSLIPRQLYPQRREAPDATATCALGRLQMFDNLERISADH